MKLANGMFSIAALQYSDNSVLRATNGLPSKQALDLRLKDFALGPEDILHAWLAEGYAGPGTGDKTARAPVDYVATNGTAVGLRYRHLVDGGYNDLAALYGTRVMQSLTLNDTAYVVDGTTNNQSTRLRLVEHWAAELSPRWALEASSFYELAHSGGTTSIKNSWNNFGLRPIYYITEHYHLATEYGYSIVQNDGDVNNDGSLVGRRTLSRVTLAPEVALGSGLFTRPVIRAFVTYCAWNEANAARGVNTHSLIQNLNSLNTVALNGRLDTTQVGFEGEVWF